MEKASDNRKKTAQQYIRTLIYIAFAVVVLLITGNVLSKYVYKNKGETLVSSHEFYFKSDYLTKEGAEYTLAPNTNSLEIELYNSEDNLRFSSDEVSYTVTVNGSEHSSGTLAPDTKSTALITLYGLTNGGVYEVTAVGNAGFEKSLYATFRVLEGEDGLYKAVKNTDEYVSLTVWAEAVSGDLIITFPDALIADNTDDAMASVLLGDTYFTDSQNFTSAYSSHTYRFFKTVSDDYSADSFSAIIGTTQATVKTPDK